MKYYFARELFTGVHSEAMTEDASEESRKPHGEGDDMKTDLWMYWLL